MSTLRIETLETYRPEDAVQLGRLMTYLSDEADGRPTDSELLKDMIASEYHRQYVAWVDSMMVGAASLSIVMGTYAGRYAYLNDLVVDPAYRQYHVGSQLYAEIEAWCRDNDLAMEFTSGDKRIEARRFYQSRAEIRETTVFRAFDNKE